MVYIIRSYYFDQDRVLFTLLAYCEARQLRPEVPKLPGPSLEKAAGLMICF